MFRKLDLGESHQRPVTISIDGVDLVVPEGEAIAAILLRTAPYTSRVTPVSNSPRAPYCMMGVCFECLVSVDGETSRRACLERAREGMVVVRQPSRPDPLKDLAA